MPPSVAPYRQRILENVATTLRTINGGSNYYHTVKTTSVVLDPIMNIATVPTTELPYMIVEPTPNGSRFYHPAYQLKNIFQVLITARMDATGISHDRKMIVWERLYHDIEKALIVDITRGGIGYDTRIDEPTPTADIGSGNMVLLFVPIYVHYIRTFGQP